jgi:hypothetical protein
MQGSEEAKAVHTRCRDDGADVCRWELSWKARVKS